MIPDAMPTGSYPPAVRVKGTENGLPFSANLAPSDSITVQNPSQLAISSTTVTPSDSVTADQAAAWFASIRVDNNGGATVRLDSLARQALCGFEGGHVRVHPHACSISIRRSTCCAAERARTFVVRFNDNAAGPMTTGTIVIESTMWGRDMNSGAVLVATTEFGGKGSYLVQTPANLVFVAVVSSVGHRDGASDEGTGRWTSF